MCSRARRHATWTLPSRSCRRQKSQQKKWCGWCPPILNARAEHRPDAAVRFCGLSSLGDACLWYRLFSRAPVRQFSIKERDPDRWRRSSLAVALGLGLFCAGVPRDGRHAAQGRALWRRLVSERRARTCRHPETNHAGRSHRSGQELAARCAANCPLSLPPGPSISYRKFPSSVRIFPDPVVPSVRPLEKSLRNELNSAGRSWHGTCFFTMSRPHRSEEAVSSFLHTGLIRKGGWPVIVPPGMRSSQDRTERAKQ